MKTIFAAIDFSPVSRRVVDQAVELARLLDARLVLLHFVKPPPIVTDLGPMVGDVLKFTAEVERGARRNLHQLQQRLVRRGVAAEAICELGFPVPQLLAHARRLEPAYIVLGSHGHTALFDLVVGSTASGVLKRAPCPVVVVPSHRKGAARPLRPARVTTRRRDALVPA